MPSWKRTFSLPPVNSQVGAHRRDQLAGDGAKRVVAAAIVPTTAALQALIGTHCRLTTKPLRTVGAKPSLVPNDDDL